MKTRITIVMCLLFAGLAGAVALYVTEPEPKYVYAVKENIVHAETWTGYELWCNHEYSNGHIERRFIGNFKIEGTGARRGYIETDLCPIKGVVSLEQM